MFELMTAGEHTWYMSAPTNVGFYLHAPGKVCMIDVGDQTCAERALEHIRARGWELTALYLTHSHTDHVSGAAWLRNQTNCRVYAPGVSAAAVKHSFLVATTLYGGRPCPEMCSKLLLPPPCECSELSPEDMPEGLEYRRLDGHDMAQAVFRTRDGVWFTADAVISASALEKHRISFVYDIGQHLRSMEELSGFEGSLFIPSHDEPCRDIRPLVEVNSAAVREVADDIVEMCSQPRTIDELIAMALEKYHIRLYLMQYLLVGQTVRSHVSRLLELGRLNTVYSGTSLYFSRVAPAGDTGKCTT